MEDKVILEFRIVERTSKKGNTYRCLVAYDTEDTEYFICFVK